MKEMSAEIFGDIMNEFITKQDISVLIEMPAGTQEPTIRGGTGNAREQILPSANVLEFQLDGSSKLTIRPSGTEPKIKVYLFAKGATKEESLQTLGSLKTAAGELLD